MKNNTRRSAGQAGIVEGTRTNDLSYVRIPDVILRLPASERVAAIEVWTALFHYLRLGCHAIRVTDDALGSVPCLGDRSGEHIRKGIAILEREGLITRIAKGSRRELAIKARLKGKKPPPAAPSPAPTIRKLQIVAPEHHEPGWATAHWAALRDQLAST